MLTSNLVSKTLKEVRDFEEAEIYLTDKVKYSQFKTVKKIITHQNNGWEKASDKKRFFFNNGNSRVDTGVKKLDFDTKDIDVEVDNFDPGLKLLLHQEIKQFNKDYHQGERLNEFVEDFVDWGNVVGKEDEDEVYKKLNIANLYLVDITAETLEDTTTIEKHQYSVTELRRMEEWDNIDELIDEADQENPNFDIYERRGQMTLGEFKEENGEVAKDEDYDKFIDTMAVVGVPQRDNKTRMYFGESLYSQGRLLYLAEIKPKKRKDGKYYAKPYKEAHFGAYQGRWLRKGYREILFDYQDRANVLGNQIYEAMKYSALHLFWSQDQQLAGKNVFKSLQHGDIITANHMAVLPVEERNLSAHINEWNRLMELADRECQTFEVATGEQLPSGTTLGGIQIQTQAVGQFFEFKREKLGLFVESIYNDWVLPKILSDKSAEHLIEITGDGNLLESVYKAAANVHYIKNLVNMPPHTPEMAQMFKDEVVNQMRQKPAFVINVLEGTYEAVKARVRVNITGENVNKQNRISNALQLLNVITNPAIQQNDEARKLAMSIGADLGFNLNIQPLEMAPTAPQQPEQVQPEMQKEQPNA